MRTIFSHSHQYHHHHHCVIVIIIILLLKKHFKWSQDYCESSTISDFQLVFSLFWWFQSFQHILRKDQDIRLSLNFLSPVYTIYQMSCIWNIRPNLNWPSLVQGEFELWLIAGVGSRRGAQPPSCQHHQHRHRHSHPRHPHFHHYPPPPPPPLNRQHGFPAN